MCYELLFNFLTNTSVVEWLACSLRVWWIVGYSSGGVKPKTIKLIFAASALSTQY